MTDYERGDVVLVRIGRPGDEGMMQRPAVVISSQVYHTHRRQLVISAVTAATSRMYAGDQPIHHWEEAGLLFPSVATGVLTTIETNAIVRRIGGLAAEDLEALNRQLTMALGL